MGMTTYLKGTWLRQILKVHKYGTLMLKRCVPKFLHTDDNHKSNSRSLCSKNRSICISMTSFGSELWLACVPRGPEGWFRNLSATPGPSSWCWRRLSHYTPDVLPSSSADLPDRRTLRYTPPPRWLTVIHLQHATLTPTHSWRSSNLTSGIFLTIELASLGRFNRAVNKTV